MEFLTQGLPQEGSRSGLLVKSSSSRPRCPLTDEWIKKLWYIYTVEYYSAIKGNTFESVLVGWMNLEPIIQAEEVRKRKINIIF